VHYPGNECNGKSILDLTISAVECGTRLDLQECRPDPRLADSLELLGRRDDAFRLFERLLGLHNDVGLLSLDFRQRLE
jgi:hypothetical protein